MQTQERRLLLKGYIMNVLDRKDDLIEFIYKDNQKSFLVWDQSIDQIKYTSDNLRERLDAIAEDMFESFDGDDGGRHSKKLYYAAALLIYSIKVDDFLRKRIDYQPDLLPDVLENILMGINFQIPAKD